MGNFLKSDKIFFLIIWLILSELASPGHKFWYLTFFQFIPFFYVIKKYEKDWLINSIIFGFFYYILYYRWLINPVKFVNLSPFTYGILNVTLMGIYQTIYFTIFAYFLKKFRNIFIPSIIWGLLEYIKANVLTGFPWGELSYNIYKIPHLIQITRYISSEGLSSFIIFINLFFFEFFNLKKSYKIFGSIIIIVFILTNLILFYNCYFKIPNLKIAIIQGNIPEEIKLDDKNLKYVIEKYINLTKKVKDFNLIIWPEAIYTSPYENDNSSIKKTFQDFIKNNHLNLIFGSPRIEIDEKSFSYKYFNSLYLINSKLEIQVYDKIKLVPFGEYTPYRKILYFVNKLVPGEDYSSGNTMKFLQFKSYKIIPLICYEGIFRNLLKRKGDFIINISNEAWFGNSNALWQHLAANVLRTVEAKKFFFKCANSGISAIINPKGEIIQFLGPNIQGIIKFNPKMRRRKHVF